MSKVERAMWTFLPLAWLLIVVRMYLQDGSTPGACGYKPLMDHATAMAVEIETFRREPVRERNTLWQSARGFRDWQRGCE